MGNCMQINSKLDEINRKLDKLEDIGYAHSILYEENKRLKRKSLELQMKIENYGMVFSGNPCRLTPSSNEISKRVGHNTI